MLSDEEKQAIDIIKNEIKAFETVITAMEKEIDDKDWLRKNILEIKGDILVRKTLLNLIEKQSKEIEELKTINQMQKYRIEVIDERELISKDKIKEILGIEEDINNEKLLSLLQTIVDENARLEDIEDRKVQIEYNNVFNKGVKSVEDKIKAKIEEVKDGTYDAKIVLESLLEKELKMKDIFKENKNLKEENKELKIKVKELENELLKVEDYPKVEKLEQKSNYDEILTHIPRID